MSPNCGLLTDLGECRERAQAIVREALPFGFDTEAGYDGETREKASLHPEENFIVGLSFTNSLRWARYVPLRHDSGVNVDNAFFAELMWDMLYARDEEGLPLGVAHGAKFERRTMARWFLRYLADHPRLGEAVRAAHGYFPVRSCTLLESFAEGENPRHGLKEVTELTFGHKMTELLELYSPDLTKKEKDSIRFNVLDQHDPKVYSYACEDSVYSLANHLRRFPYVRDSLIYKLEMGVLDVVCDMEDEGLCYDWNFMREAARKAREFNERYQAEVLGDLSELAGKRVIINLNSSQQLSKVLYDDCGMPVRRWTPGGKSGVRKPSVDAKTALKGLAKQYAAVQKLLNWKGLNTLCNNFLDTYEGKFSYAPDGRAHPGLMQHGTITGRFSAEGPNYQQSPKKYHVELADWSLAFDLNFRDAIVAPSGWYFLGFDFSQIELRVFAGEAGETTLLEAFQSGQDVHRLTAALMLGKRLEDVTKHDRDIGKTMNFALAYGMTEDGLADRLGITVPEAEAKFAQYFAAYPALRQWTERTISQAKRDGYVMTRFGRKVCIREFDSAERRIRREGERTAGNAPIQGSATGDYVKIAMVRARKALKEAGLDGRVRLVMNVHDALEWYVHKDVTPADVIAVLQPAVIFPVSGWPPMVAEWHLGTRWGSVRELELLPDGDVRIVPEDEERPAAAVVSPAARLGDHELTPQEQGRGELKSMSYDYDDVHSHGGGPPRTVVVEVVRRPTGEQARQFVALLRGTPGDNSVVLRIPGEDGSVDLVDLAVASPSGLCPYCEPSVSVIFGGAIVHYDLDSVDVRALARGLEL